MEMMREMVMVMMAIMPTWKRFLNRSLSKSLYWKLKRTHRNCLKLR
jgi:hypothetical protein